MKSPQDFFSQNKKPQGPRPLRVGEEIRRVLSDIFMRGDVHAEGLSGASITVSEVRVSPDLKNATAFIMPLGGRDKDVLLKILIEAAPEIRHLVSQRVELRHAPKIYFALDESFDAAQKIETILKKPEVARDLRPTDDE
jgi:ribosome-binding factor A